MRTRHAERSLNLLLNARKLLMDLLIWRHAQAENLDPKVSDAASDLARPLTPRGEHQAERVAAWIEPRLPKGSRILSSPALRCESTVAYLGRKYKLQDELAPSGTSDDILQLLKWPDTRLPTVLVGHQPALGELIARLIGAESQKSSVRKGALWWLQYRERDGAKQMLIHAVVSPELL
jgi:phosphohistidine phosphatase